METDEVRKAAYARLRELQDGERAELARGYRDSAHVLAATDAARHAATIRLLLWEADRCAR
jgi:hypothetical protein